MDAGNYRYFDENGIELKRVTVPLNRQELQVLHDHYLELAGTAAVKGNAVEAGRLYERANRFADLMHEL